MSRTCVHLRPFQARAIALGNHERTVAQGWSEAERVVQLARRMPDALRTLARAAAPPLRYYRASATPHGPGDEGLFCLDCRIGLAFPLGRP